MVKELPQTDQRPDFEIRRRIDSACDQFETQWQAGERPKIEDLVRDFPEETRATLVRELLLVELELRQQAGEVVTSGDYDKRLSEFRLVVDEVFSSRSFKTVFSDKTLVHDDFEGVLSDRKIVSEAALEKARAQVAGTSDSGSLIQTLVDDGQLTQYQVGEITCGRADRLVLGNYIIRDKIGAGGMGQVFLAWHRRMRREVALKILPEEQLASPSIVERFEREVHAAAQLDHPNIVTAHDADEAGGIHFLVMQHVQGRDLAEHIRSNGPLPVRKAMEFCLQAARGLEYSHEQGIVHRDIKPANLLLDAAGVVKILDMGLARIANEQLTGTQAQITQDGSMLGTVDFMAPEQALSAKDVDARADIYSLGCTLYYLLTGQPTYSGDSLMARMLAHREAPIPLLSQQFPDAPDDLDPIIARSLAKHREDRFANMTELIAAFESCIQSLPDNLRLVAAETEDEQATSETSRLIEDTLPETPIDGSDLRDSASTLLVNSVIDQQGRSRTKPTSIFACGLAAICMLGGAFLLYGPVYPQNDQDGAVTTATVDKTTAATQNLANDGSDTVAGSPDRRAAEYVLAAGGRIDLLVNGRKVNSISDLAQLPEEPFHIVTVGSISISKLNDETLLHLRGLSMLTGLYLTDTAISDRGLANLTDEGRTPLPALKRLYLDKTTVTEDGLRQLVGCDQLEMLTINETQVADVKFLNEFPRLSFLEITKLDIATEDLVALQELSLTTFSVEGSQVLDDSGKELAKFRHLKQLTLRSPPPELDPACFADLAQLNTLMIQGGNPLAIDDEFWLALTKLPLLETLNLQSAISAETLAGLKPLPQLRTLMLYSDQIGGQAMVEAVAKLPGLRDVSFVFSGLDDDDVEHLKSLTELTNLNLGGNTITPIGFESLHEALPHCTIIAGTRTWPATPPTVSLDRRAAELVLSLGGTVKLCVGNRKLPAISDPARLPTGAFHLLTIGLDSNSQVNDETLTEFRGLPNLNTLYLAKTAITDRGLANLTDEGRVPLPALTGGHLYETKITENGLRFLTGCAQLDGLLISGTQINDATVLNNFANLSYLDIVDCDISADNFADLQGTALAKLLVNGSQITGAGGERLSKFETLQELTVEDLGAEFDVSDLKNLAQLKSLTIIRGAGAKFDEPFWSTINKLPQLEALRLRVGISSESLALLKPIPTLNTLEVSSYYVDAQGIAAAVTKLPNLRKLEILNSLLDDEDVEDLKSLTQLTYLNLGGNSITLEGFETLHQALPNCTIRTGSRIWRAGQ